MLFFGTINWTVKIAILQNCYKFKYPISACDQILKNEIKKVW